MQYSETELQHSDELIKRSSKRDRLSVGPETVLFIQIVDRNGSVLAGRIFFTFFFSLTLIRVAAAVLKSSPKLHLSYPNWSKWVSWTVLFE